MAQAQTELSVIATDLERAYPDTNRNQRIAVRTELQNRIAAIPTDCQPAGDAHPARRGRAVRRVRQRRGIAGEPRAGAGSRDRPAAGHRGRTSRVVRQLITESVLIAVVGGVLGLGVGYAGVTLFSQFQIPTDLPIVASFELDRRALLVSLVVALVSAVLFGLAPAIRSTRADLTAVMKATDAAGFGRRRRWGRAVLVAGQVAVSVVLLVVATFIYRGFQQQLGERPGLSHRSSADDEPRAEPAAVTARRRRQRFFERVAERARLVPGVKSAALTRYMPMDGGPPPVTIVPEGFQFPAGQESATHGSSIVDEHYFDTIGLPILKGRGFRATDSADAPKVAVVNEAARATLLARAGSAWQAFSPGQQPGTLGGDRRCREDDQVQLHHREAHRVSSIFPTGSVRRRSMFLLADRWAIRRVSSRRCREVVRSLDANLPISNTRTMEELYRMRSVVILNVIISLIAAMGMMGLALALVGLYGLVAYAASRRTKEIGIRMAIGAGRSDVLRMVLRQGMVLAIAGLGVGLLASAGAARALAAIFPGGPGGDGRTDFVAFPLVAATVLAVTLLAAYLPARRASRVNPTEALRQE